MTDVQTQVTQAVATATAEVKTFREKVVAFVKAHVPTAVGSVVGYAGGHFGLIGAVLKHLI
jgi:hypothetical protein